MLGIKKENSVSELFFLALPVNTGKYLDLADFFAAESVARGLQVEHHFNGIANKKIF